MENGLHDVVWLGLPGSFSSLGWCSHQTQPAAFHPELSGKDGSAVVDDPTAALLTTYMLWSALWINAWRLSPGRCIVTPMDADEHKWVVASQMPDMSRDWIPALIRAAVRMAVA